ncbi:hypothetical protein BvCmsKSNP071_03084 [Escherichia coli]|nr:hypothetical protein BvCmsKSNP071_03084 [Escherichia coli]
MPWMWRFSDYPEQQVQELFVMTAMPGQRWHLQCGSLTARTGKASIRRLILPASAVCCKRMRTPGSTSCIAMVG